jgi:hypothetical protein
MGKQGVAASDVVSLSMQGLSVFWEGIVLCVFSRLQPRGLLGTHTNYSRSAFFRSRNLVPVPETTLLQPQNYFGSDRV